MSVLLEKQQINVSEPPFGDLGVTYALRTRIQWYQCGPSRVISNKGSRPQIWGTVYICEVNGATKGKFNAQVTVNKDTDHVQKIFFTGVWEDSIVELGSSY